MINFCDDDTAELRFSDKLSLEKLIELLRFLEDQEYVYAETCEEEMIFYKEDNKDDSDEDDFNESSEKLNSLQSNYENEQIKNRELEKQIKILEDNISVLQESRKKYIENLENKARQFDRAISHAKLLNTPLTRVLLNNE
jgi:hydroxymethylpyrimidine pyrophosphatase-like HAD family hydrolase